MDVMCRRLSPHQSQSRAAPPLRAAAAAAGAPAARPRGARGGAPHRTRPRASSPVAAVPLEADARPAAVPPEPAAAAAAAAARQAPDALPVVVRPASGLLELRQVARLRAEAYYADDRSRFAESFKRQFASQEADSLAHRTAPRGGRAPQCDCLVALDAEGGGAVVGCIDIRVPQAATGLPASGVPPGEDAGAYILNVVVAEHARGRGVGRTLMRAAMARAVRVWGAARLFTHVEAGNDVAAGLYRGCGFADHSDTGALAGAATLGRLLLLVAEADQVDASVPSGGDPAPAPAA